MSTEAQAPSPAKATGTKPTAFAATIGALLSAPCVIYLVVLPLGLGALGMTAAYAFFDNNRLIFMALTVVLLALAHIQARRTGSTPTFLWIVTVIAVGLMLVELIVDPPWERHAYVPM